MGSRSTKSLKTMMLIAVPSLVLFIIMFIMTNHSNEVAFHNFMKVNFGMTNRWSKSLWTGLACWYKQGYFSARRSY